jgi:hypothetical protein
MGRPLPSAASIGFSLFFSCEVNIGSDMWIIEMHNHRLFECSLWIARHVSLIAMYRHAKKLLKLFVRVKLLQTRWSPCVLRIMLVLIVLHVHPMPVIQEFELIELNSFIHGRISYKHAGFHYISYILQLKRGALEV